MDKYDRLIAEALGAEDRDLLHDMGEQGFFTQALGLLRGRNGWVAVVMVTVQSVMFAASVWAGWHFFTAPDVLTALKWGLPAAVLVLMATQLKMALMPQLQADRVLRALRRLELRLAVRE